MFHFGQRTVAAGGPFFIRITGSVSGITNLLVSDGTINGNKDADAAKLGVRSVTPDKHRKLLDYVQPALSDDKQPSAVGHTVSTETLVCTKCALTFVREASKGRKPQFCETCR